VGRRDEPSLDGPGCRLPRHADRLAELAHDPGCGAAAHCRRGSDTGGGPGRLMSPWTLVRGSTAPGHGLVATRGCL